MRVKPTIVCTLALALAAPAAMATVVSGRVTEPGGSGIADVDVDFIDRNTGQSIPLENDNTDILGFYAVTVPTGDYDVQFDPAPGDRFVGHEERNVRVQGASQTLDAELAPGFFVSGRVVDESSVPAADVDLDFIDLADGELYTSHDKTDLAGNFSVVVPAALYDIEFEPPVGSDLVPKLMADVNVTADLPLGDVVLLHGVHLTGTVVDPLSVAVAGVQVRTLDPATGEEIFNIRRNTDALGAYDLVVAPGGYDLLYVPPRGEPVLPRFLSGVTLFANLTLPTVMLDDGVVATGKVLDPAGDPAQGVDLDFHDDLSGVERFTPRDNVDDRGEYAVTVPAGAYDIRYDPFLGSGWASAQLLNVDLPVDTGLPDVQLQTGRNVSGHVQDSLGNALAGVDLDFFDSVSGLEIPATNENTDAFGDFGVLVPSGTYDIVFSPVPGSGVGQETRLNVVVGGDVNLGTIVLQDSSAAAPGGITPSSGGAGGGTAVTVTGSNFAPGVQVRLGGVPLSGIVRISETTVQGTTGAHRVGLADVEVINPGAPLATLGSAFDYTAPASDPVLTLHRAGPLNTDVLMEWTNTGQASYRLFRSTDPASLGAPFDELDGLSYRDDGAASPTAADDLVFYLVQ